MLACTAARKLSFAICSFSIIGCTVLNSLTNHGVNQRALAQHVITRDDLVPNLRTAKVGIMVQQTRVRLSSTSLA